MCLTQHPMSLYRQPCSPLDHKERLMTVTDVPRTTTTTAATATATTAPPARRLDDPVFQAFSLLRIGFTVAPILFGLDKFLNWLVHWQIYLAPEFNDLIPGNAHQAMLA